MNVLGSQAKLVAWGNIMDILTPMLISVFTLDSNYWYF